MNRNIKWIAMAAGLVIVLAFLSLRLGAQPQPKIAWSPSQVQLALSQGQGRTGTVTFTSDHVLQNVTLETVPAIAPFVNFQPKAFSYVPAGIAQSVSIAFTAAPNTVGTYDGTIHLRDSNSTYPQTLKISLQIVSPLGIGLTTLAQRDQLVVLGTVRSVQSALDQPGTNIFTTVSLAITRVLKGSVPSGAVSLTIQFRGGTVGQISSLVPGSPSFTLGETVVTFLDGSDSSGNYSLPEQALGTFHILTDPTVGQIAVIDQAYLQKDTLEANAPDFKQLIAKSSQQQLSLTEFLTALGVSP